MLAKVFEVVQVLVQVAAIAAVVVEIMADTTGAKGAEKKAQAIAKMKELLPPERLGGLAFLYDPIANFLIDAVVAYANAKGFFPKASA